MKKMKIMKAKATWNNEKKESEMASKASAKINIESGVMKINESQWQWKKSISIKAIMAINNNGYQWNGENNQ